MNRRKREINERMKRRPYYPQPIWDWCRRFSVKPEDYPMHLAEAIASVQRSLPDMLKALTGAFRHAALAWGEAGRQFTRAVTAATEYEAQMAKLERTLKDRQRFAETGGGMDAKL